MEGGGPAFLSQGRKNQKYFKIPTDRVTLSQSLSSVAFPPSSPMMLFHAVNSHKDHKPGQMIITSSCPTM